MKVQKQINGCQYGTENAELRIEEEAKFFTRLRNQVFINLIKRTNSKSVIDMGCGTGKVTVDIAGHFPKVDGCDISPRLIKIAKENAKKSNKKVNFILGDMAKIKTKEKYDCVLFAGVLEHIPNDVAALKNMKNVLKAGGYVVIEIPAFMALWNKRDTMLGHYRRYTKRMIRQKLEKAGYEIIFMKYWKFSMIFGNLLTKVLNRNEYPYFVLNSLTKKFVEIWYKIFENNYIFPVGESIDVIARLKTKKKYKIE